MKIAVIATVWFPFSHADVMVARWFKPYPTDALHGWARPRSQIASVYLEQLPSNDIGKTICRRHGVPMFESIRDALMLGTSDLAVDAVLLIAEHGEYPRTEFGQKMYPRKRMFDEIAEVFREHGRSLPVFNDKHLSWDFGHAREMMETARNLNIPLYAGSSLPHCPLDPECPCQDGEKVSEAVALFHGDQDNYGFHTIEFAQSLLERRLGGEGGIRAVRSFRGGGVIGAIDMGEISADLLTAALVGHGYPEEEDLVFFILERTEDPIAYQIEHHDGLSVTHLRLNKLVWEWVVSVRRPAGGIASCLAGMGNAGDFFGNFARLDAVVEEFFLTRTPPTPLMRTYLATGALQSVQHALKQPGKWIETPHLCLRY